MKKKEIKTEVFSVKTTKTVAKAMVKCMDAENRKRSTLVETILINHLKEKGYLK